MKIAIVGAGIHGSSTAKVLASRGHKVTLFEQFPLLHELGSSHGESRIVRKAYPDRFYTSLMAEAYPLWQDLETESGQKLLHEVGLAYFGHQDAPNLQTVVEGLKDVEEPHQILDASSVQTVSPQLRLADDEVAVFTKRAGWVEAQKCVAVTHELAKRAGASVEVGRRVEREWLEANFDAFVVAPGSWVLDWAPTLDVKVTLQTVAYFGADISGPVWIEDSVLLAYGFPTLSPSLGVKVAYHSYGRAIDPSLTDRTPDPSLLSGLASVLTKRFAVGEPKLLRTYGCLYTNTPDEDFRFGRVGKSGFFVSACSGHGFKFGPWIGRCMADLVEGRRSLSEFLRFLHSESR
jgi:monomeric sarcosine oxidase